MAEFLSEHLVALSAVSATAGAMVQSQGLLAPVSAVVGVVAGKFADLALGIMIAAVGWKWQKDGISDALEAFGIGFAFSALV